MNSKVWLTTFGIVSLLVLAGGGFYAFSSYGKYSEALEEWDGKVGTIETLERRVPYPNEENADALGERVAAYEASVTALSETLKTFQRPLNTELQTTEFQQLVSTRVQEFRRVAADAGLGLETDTEFQLGFDSYANNLPAPELVPVLDYSLEAIDHLLRKLIECGATKLTTFQRDSIPGEAGVAARHESGVVHKYPVRLRFQGSHDAFQRFVNALANDKQFFYVVRVLKVANEVLEGPLKLTAEGGVSSFAKFENPTTKEVASPDLLAAWSEGGASAAEIEEKARAAGFIKADQDARVLMGQENLNVFMVVDITRFLGPEEVVAAEPEAEKRKGRR